MDLVQSRRPVVLIVEEDFLLRVDAADMIGRRTASAQALEPIQKLVESDESDVIPLRGA
jgi:hypothetical protein